MWTFFSTEPYIKLGLYFLSYTKCLVFQKLIISFHLKMLSFGLLRIPSSSPNSMIEPKILRNTVRQMKWYIFLWNIFFSEILKFLLMSGLFLSRHATQMSFRNFSLPSFWGFSCLLSCGESPTSWIPCLIFYKFTLSFCRRSSSSSFLRKRGWKVNFSN